MRRLERGAHQRQVALDRARKAEDHACQAMERAQKAQERQEVVRLRVAARALWGTRATHTEEVSAPLQPSEEAMRLARPRQEAQVTTTLTRSAGKGQAWMLNLKVLYHLPHYTMRTSCKAPNFCLEIPSRILPLLCNPCCNLRKCL